MIDKECTANVSKQLGDSDFKRMTYTEAIDYLIKQMLNLKIK